VAAVQNYAGARATRVR